MVVSMKSNINALVAYIKSHGHRASACGSRLEVASIVCFPNGTSAWVPEQINADLKSVREWLGY